MKAYAFAAAILSTVSIPVVAETLNIYTVSRDHPAVNFILDTLDMPSGFVQQKGVTMLCEPIASPVTDTSKVTRYATDAEEEAIFMYEPGRLRVVTAGRRACSDALRAVKAGNVKLADVSDAAVASAPKDAPFLGGTLTTPAGEPVHLLATACMFGGGAGSRNANAPVKLSKDASLYGCWRELGDVIEIHWMAVVNKTIYTKMDSVQILKRPGA